VNEKISPLPVSPLAKVPRHVFGESRHVKAPRSDVSTQVERTCICGVVKITVFGVDGSAWREWRMPGCKDQFGDALGAPECSAEHSTEQST
jgi:hypothetical protein